MRCHDAGPQALLCCRPQACGEKMQNPLRLLWRGHLHSSITAFPSDYASNAEVSLSSVAADDTLLLDP